MHLLVNGLCFQGNKGGPALALSLRQQIIQQMPDARLTFSVPPGKAFKHEKRWADHYGVEVVPHTTYTGILKGRSDARRWLSALRACDAVVDLCAIAYVGPPVGITSQAVFKSRGHYVTMATLFRKPFYAWTQSYGPFSTPTIKLMARWDLKRQPIVFCRGEGCAQRVSAFVPGKDVRAYPDVAITLPWRREDGIAYLEQHDLPTDNIVTISPSAVVYRKTHGEGLDNHHVVYAARLCDHFARRGFKVILVPHTLRVSNPKATHCDLEVCKLVMKRLANSGAPTPRCIVEDLTPMQLKSIISCAQAHIGARYHSIIASLSTYVPTTAMSWHQKYKDILLFYGLEHAVANGLDDTVEACIAHTEAQLSQRAQIVEQLTERHQNAVSLVHENARLFCDLLKRHQR